MSDGAAKALANKTGTICYEEPADWVEGFAPNENVESDEDGNSGLENDEDKGTEQHVGENEPIIEQVQNYTAQDGEEIQDMKQDTQLAQIQSALSEIQGQLRNNVSRLDAIENSLKAPPPNPGRMPEPGFSAQEQAPAATLAHLSPDLQRMLELCCIYLVAVDNQYTTKEQKWIDNHFGSGTSIHITRTIEIINWEKFFPHIYNLISALTLPEKSWLREHSPKLFHELLECDGLELVEQEQLHQLCQFIDHSCGSTTEN